MSTTVEKIVEQAMSLPGESRAEVADLLVQSLETAELGQIDRLWIAEATRRRDEVRSGEVETVPGEQALRRVRDSLRR
jgi:hypothetical protein